MHLIRILLVLLPTAFSAFAADIHTIRVLDDQTGRGVPLVELRTTNDISFWTDSAGVVAFDEPGLLGLEVFFHVTSPGYEFAKDGFGIRGIRINTSAGGKSEIKIKRTQIAERMYRVTGQGIYRDSIMAGLKSPRREPLLTGKVTGQDTVSAARYRDKIYWFYGDTNQPGYPLGNFGGTGAVSELPGRGGLDPSDGVNLTYFTGKDGFARPMFPKEEFGEGLQWIEGEFVIKDEGREKLIARVASGTGMDKTREWHLAVFDDEKGHFTKLTRWDSIDFHDSSHAFQAEVNGVPYIYLFPDFRVRAELSALRELKNYEAWTCMSGDTVDRDASGRAQYSWKPGAPRQDSRRLQKRGLLKPDESWLRLHDIETGKPVPSGRGSVFWNHFRQRWIMIISGLPGEVWFSEADTPVGPWLFARRIAGHGRYNFYNPTQHPFFDQELGRIIYFEGTYTDSFSGAPAKTPRYDYNQMMYRLTMDDPRLALPCPVYQTGRADATSELMLREGVEISKKWSEVRGVTFCAVPPSGGRRGADLIPIWQHEGVYHTSPPWPDGIPIFLALPPGDGKNTPHDTEPIHDASGKVIARVWTYTPNVLSLDPAVIPRVTVP